MIPKKIHYIWIGGKEKPPMIKKCIASWSKVMPDYEIICWDDSNLDVEKYQFSKDAYQARKYALSSDMLRYEILYEHGGILLDADVEVIKPFDELLHLEAFAGYEPPQFSGCFNPGIVNPGSVLAAVKGCSFLKDVLDVYKNMTFALDDQGKVLIKQTSPAVLTKYLRSNGLKKLGELQKIKELTIFPTDYFCPIDGETSKVEVMENTFSIHRFAGTWLSSEKQKKSFGRLIKKTVKAVLGERIVEKLKKKRANTVGERIAHEKEIYGDC
jgi:hypothetical protein